MSSPAIAQLVACGLPLHAAEGAESVLMMEHRSLNAWPAPQTALMQGWALRAAHGYSKRANSANAMHPGAALSARLLQEIEAWYARRNLPVIFRVSPLAGAGVDALLYANGYALHDPSLLMHRPVQSQDVRLPAIQIKPVLDDAWFNACCLANAVSAEHQPAHRSIFQTIGASCGYGRVLKQGRAVAWGLAVLERGAVGIYDAVVDPAERGQGHGSALLEGLLQWAAEQGAQSVDLQVSGDNRKAQSLYASLGFEVAYGYHYRIKP